MAHVQRFLRLWLGLLCVTHLACGPAVIEVQPVTSTRFQEMLEAEVRFDARRPAHSMQREVRRDPPEKNIQVLDNDKLPEAYTLDGAEGIWPSQYHLGYAALRLIREYYADAHPAKGRFERDELVEIVDRAGGNTHMVHDFDRDRHVDIADIKGRVLFEVVPPGETHLVAGKRRVDWHLFLLNQAMLGVPKFKLGTGFAGEVGVRFAEGATPWRLSWSTVEPGILQFRWQALTVEQVTEESSRRAYLTNQWHDLTTYEQTRFGRALHLVVEQLVQAREEMGQTQAAIKMPVLPGRTLVDYMETVAVWSAHDDKQAQFLPVMHGPPVELAPAKQFVGQTLPAGAGGDAEGVYDLKGKPGRQPDNLHMGNAAHILLGNHYKLWHPGETVFTNSVSISTIVEAITDTKQLLKRDEALLRPDITNVNKKVVFEIKSQAPGRLAEGQVAVAKYIAIINKYLDPKQQFKPGTEFAGDFWVRFNKVLPWWRIKWETTAPGVVQYKWQKLDNEEVDEHRIWKGIQAGKYAWVDLTEGEMQPYALECETFARQRTNIAQKLYKMQVLSGLTVELVGHAAIVYVSPGLAPNSNAVPKGAAKATQPGPRVRVGVDPTPKTRVNASPAPEPMGEPEVVPDVAARSKM